MVDLDRFKLVNDTWGHAAGDRLLVVMVERLQSVVDHYLAADGLPSGAVVRMGGDEFLVVLDGPEPIDPVALKRAVLSVAGPIDVGAEEPVELEFSVGVATAERPAQFDELLTTADLRMYEDKRRRHATSDPAIRPEPDTVSQ